MIIFTCVVSGDESFALDGAIRWEPQEEGVAGWDDWMGDLAPAQPGQRQAELIRPVEHVQAVVRAPVMRFHLELDERLQATTTHIRDAHDRCDNRDIRDIHDMRDIYDIHGIRDNYDIRDICGICDIHNIHGILDIHDFVLNNINFCR